MPARANRRTKRTGSLYQRCESARGCPPLEDGPISPLTGRPTRIRPKHVCRGAWVAAVDLPVLDGERRRKVVVRAKKADALAELKKLRDQLERAGDLNTSSPTLSVWMDVWWERYALDRLKVSTRPSYQSKIEQYIRPCLGHIRLDRLGPEHVKRLADYVRRTKGLSSSSANGAHRVLSVVLADAEREGKIGRNPCALVKAPGRNKRQVTYLDGSEARALLASADPGDGTVPTELAMWAVAVLTGMRPGERLGITREMVDLDEGTITVAWQLQRLTFEHGCGEQDKDEKWPCGRSHSGYCPKRHLDIPDDQEAVNIEGGLYLTRPKSAAGWRVIPMVGVLRAILERYLTTHEPGSHGLIFTRPGGRPRDPNKDHTQWHAALDAAGLPSVKRHSARHTANTVLTELGVPVDVRQKILGHASRAVNEAVYTHTSDARVVAAMQQLGAAMDWREA